MHYLFLILIKLIIFRFILIFQVYVHEIFSLDCLHALFIMEMMIISTKHDLYFYNRNLLDLNVLNHEHMRLLT